MAKNETSKSKAELYREERKARIAKAAKQNSKNIEKRKKASKALKIAVSAVLVVAIVIAVAGNSIVGALSNVFTAVKIGDTKISATQFNYYYTVAYSDIASQSAELEEYYGTNVWGFDSSVPLDEQETTDEDGNTTTWAEIVKERALAIAQQSVGYSNEAIAAGITLSEDQEAELNETIESLRTEAASNNSSLNAYLSRNYGFGFNEKALRKLIERDMLAQNFADDKQSEIDNSFTDDVLTEEYEANKKNYDYTDIRYYSLSFKTLTAEEGESEDDLKKRQTESNDKFIADAKDILSKATDEDAFIEAVKAYNDSETDTTKKSLATTYSSLKTAISEDGAEWVYADGRKAGDKTVIEGESAAYVVYVISPAYTSNSVSVRHCLVAFDAEDSENVTDDEKKAAYKEAETLLNGLGDDFSEDDFSAMATENTADEASASTGGLYENIRISDNYVENFETWSFDPARKAGDTGIIETDYGYHIMYFVSDNTDDLDWKNTIKSEKSEEALTAYQEELFAEDGKNAIVEKDFWVNYIISEICDNMRKSLAYSQVS